jgi:hypothetical protein
VIALFLQEAAAPPPPPLFPSPPSDLPSPDTLRAVLHDVFARGEYRWETHTDVLAWLRDHFFRLMSWMEGLERSHPVSYYALLVAMGIVLLAILAHFAYVMSRAFRTTLPETADGGGRPAAARRDGTWYEAEARRLSAEGRYAEALAHRFVALIMDLDRRQALRFHAAKTPAEYAAEARLDESSRGRLRTLVLMLYHHLFAAVPCTVNDWAAFDREARSLAAEARVATV